MRIGRRQTAGNNVPVAAPVAGKWVFALETIRVWFRKEGVARFISHLDLNRCMARAVKRAGIPAWYTEGFNPHLFLTFALPLSLGTEGEMESMDLKIVKDMPLWEIQKRLNQCLPEGLTVTGVTLPEERPGEIDAAEYEIILEGFSLPAEKAVEKIESVCAQPQLLTEKKTKAGNKEIDLKPSLRSMRMQVLGDKVKMLLLLPAGSRENINPSLLLDTIFAGWDQKPFYRIRRTKVMDLHGNLFH